MSKLVTKIIIAGGRDIFPKLELIDALIQQAMDSFDIKREEVFLFEGGADGVDSVGKNWAKTRKVPFRTFEADWKKFGLSAGPVRNEAMAKLADVLILIWNGNSSGSGDMLKRAKAHGLEIIELRII